MHSADAVALNRLAGERSPYLLLHASNPVDWWPWGGDAIEVARQRDVPLFLSIGYATCHWCHVMARESFRDPIIGRRLDELFVCVKVDREERPEVDEVCMTACQVFTQLVEGRPSGGWPLSIWLEPTTLTPFFVGTYFPPEPGHGRPSFSQVIESLGTAWRTRRSEVVEQAKRLGSMVTRQLSPEDAPAPIAESLPFDAAVRLMSMQDHTNGGFGGAPKFPQPCFLELLLEIGTGSAGTDPAHRATARAPMLETVRRTLIAMATGGICDQVGGGFHRYAVDAEWVVPHFEKMLYDNGQLASLYARAAIIFDDRRLLDVARRTCDCVLREMSSPEGGFACALDAEVNGHEGEGYVWSRAAFAAALAQAGLADDTAWAEQTFGVSERANFRDPHDPHAAPAHVLLDRLEWSVAEEGRTSASTQSLRLDRVRAALLQARNAGPRPAIDDKVIPSWNGFMIDGLAETARALRLMARRAHGPAAPAADSGSWADTARVDAERFVHAAVRAADFVLTSMRRADGELLRVARNGSAAVSGSLEDYGSMASALLTMACIDAHAERWLSAAKSLLTDAEKRFADDRGGWFDAPAGGLLFVRARSSDDGALPSGTTLMIEAHRRLAEIEIASMMPDAPAERLMAHRHPSIDRVRAALRAAAGALHANLLASTGTLTVMARLHRIPANTTHRISDAEDARP